jgi:excisionase family DNA binding protein
MNREQTHFAAVAGLPEFLTVKEIAQFLGMSEKTVRRWVQRGSLTAIKLSMNPRGALRIEKESLIHLLKLLRVKSEIMENTR